MGAVAGLAGGLGGLVGGAGQAANQAAGNYQAATNANILTPTTAGQVTTAYDQTQQGLAQQQAFMNALAAQGGIQNQSNVFNQLQGVANGTGPNPAQAMLNNTTGQNIANQAALMAGQRGAGANAGLLARQAAQQGGNLQQQAVGQGAALQANQSLGALGQLGGIAGQQVAQQGNAVQGYNQAAQNQQANLLNAIGSQNTAELAKAGQQNAINASNTALNRQTSGQLGAGLAQGGSNLISSMGGFPGISSAVGGMFGGSGGSIPAPGTQAGGINFASGGTVKKMAAGGDPGALPSNGPQSSLGQYLSGVKDNTPAPSSPDLNAYTPQQKKDDGGGSGDLMKTAAQVAPFLLAKGGKVPALVSPGEVYLSPNDVKAVEQGKKSPLAGEKIPGKAKVKGDSLKNDTVPKTLEEGGIVLPRSVTEHPHAGWEAKKFIDAIRKKKAM